VVQGFTFAKAPTAPRFYDSRIGFYDEAIAIAHRQHLMDQVHRFHAWAEGASLDLERLEVPQGPQGTLFGQNSTGARSTTLPPSRPRSFILAVIWVMDGQRRSGAGYVSGGIANGPVGAYCRVGLSEATVAKSETFNRTLGGRIRPADCSWIGIRVTRSRSNSFERLEGSVDSPGTAYAIIRRSSNEQRWPDQLQRFTGSPHNRHLDAELPPTRS